MPEDNEKIESILKERYYLPNESCWSDVCRRVANYIGETHAEKEDFYDIMNKRLFIPNSPCLMNAGTDNPLMSACFALGIDDSMDSIYEALKKSAILFKMGAGVGFDFSALRPEGSAVGTTNGVASGVVSFLNVYNESVETVKQGGKRRGAAIALLRCDHPEIEKFIDCKTIDGKLTNFNISVIITNEFMHAVTNDFKWDLVFGDVVHKTMRARDLFNKLVHASHTYGDPGFFFYDNVNDADPDKHLGDIHACNPCGEVPIRVDIKKIAGESCNLGSIDVSKLYDPTSPIGINQQQFSELIRKSVHFLNHVIEKNKYPYPEIEKMTKDTNKIGLNLMGVADLFLKMKIPYGSPESIELSKNISKFANDAAIAESILIASYDGAYPKWAGSEWANKGIPIHNSTLTCQAPTGTVSIFGGCSSGIEPCFPFVYTRDNCVGKSFYTVHPYFEQELDKLLKTDMNTTGIPEKTSKYLKNKKFQTVKDEVLDYCHKNGSIQGIEWLPDDFKAVFVTTYDVSWKSHIDIQAAFQENVGNGISKTINLKKDATEKDIHDIIFYAWKKKCKGLTIYREGSKKNEVISLKKDISDEAIQTDNEPFIYTENGETRILPKRPRTIPATIIKARSGCGKLIIPVGEYCGRPYEVPATFALKGGGCRAMLDGLNGLLGLCLRWGVPVWDIVGTLTPIRCEVAREKYKKGLADGISCPSIIGHAVQECAPDDIKEIAYPFRIKELATQPNAVIQKKLTPREPPKNVCPDCFDRGIVKELFHESGCVRCLECGYSKCG